LKLVHVFHALRFGSEADIGTRLTPRQSNVRYRPEADVCS